MATYEEAMTALRNADKAGDAAAAKQLAVIANKLKPQAQEPAPAMDSDQAASRLHAFDPNAEFQATPQKVAAPTGKTYEIGGRKMPVPQIPSGRDILQGGLKALGQFAEGEFLPSTKMIPYPLPQSRIGPAGKEVTDYSTQYASPREIWQKTMPALGPAESELLSAASLPTKGALSTAAQAAVNAPSNVAKRLLRGSDAKIPEIQQRIQTMRDVGAPISAGEALGPGWLQSLEKGAGKIPGGSGVMKAFAEKQRTAIANKATSVADSLAEVADPRIAGMRIEQGIGGKEGFMSRFRQSQNELYSAERALIPDNTRAPVSNLQSLFSTINAGTNEASELTKIIKGNSIPNLERALTADLGGKPSAPSLVLGPSGQPYMVPGVEPKTTLPLGELRRIRTLVGENIQNPNLTSDVSTSTWNRIYGALSDDIKAGVEGTGNPEAIKAFNRANSFTKAGHARIEEVLNKVIKDKTPEKVYNAAIGQTKDGSTVINGVMRSLSPAERDVVKSSVIRDLGTSGKDAPFDVNTFLNNWENIRPDAKRALFSGQDGKLRTDLDNIAKASKLVSESTKPGAFEQLGIKSSAGIVAATVLLRGAEVFKLAGAAGAASKLSERLFTNPKFVDWLATSIKPAVGVATEITPAYIPQALTVLTNAMQNEPDDVQQAAQMYAQGVMQQNKPPAPSQAPR
jgi:hypothetical protein